MITVFTMSPAIDITYHIDQVELGEVNRVQQVQKRAGGKGLNVARLLTKIGASVTLHAPLGGDSGVWITQQLEKDLVEAKITKVSAETRSALTLVGSEVTVLNEPASPLAEAELMTMQIGVEHSDVIIVTGSVPQSVSNKRFGELLMSFSSMTQNLIVDTSGEYLITASRYAHYLKPNLEELLTATGQPKQSAINVLREHGAKLLLSLGESGVELHSDKLTHAAAPKQKGNPTGAGDALTSGFAFKLSESETEALRFGCALSAASVRNQIAGDFEQLDLLELLEEVRVS